MHVAWVLWVMLNMVPNSPWVDSYLETATAIAKEAEAHPNYGDNEESIYRTMSDILAFGYTESRFNPDALGDCNPGLPETVANCQSLGLYAISKVHAASSELFIPESATYHARRLLAQSMQICKTRPSEERFAWYAAGGNGCKEKGFGASRRRAWISADILRSYPMF